MEVVGAVSAITQIAQVGVQLSLTLYNIAHGIGSANKDVQSIAKDISLFSAVLKGLGHALKKGQESKLYRNEAYNTSLLIVKECKEVFAEIQGILRKTSKDGSIPTDGNLSLDRAGKIMWLFRKSRVQLLRANLDSLKSTISVELAVLNYAEKVSTTSARVRQRSIQTNDINSLKSLVLANGTATRELRDLLESTHNETSLTESLSGRIATRGVGEWATVSRRNQSSPHGLLSFAAASRPGSPSPTYKCSLDPRIGITNTPKTSQTVLETPEMGLASTRTLSESPRYLDLRGVEIDYRYKERWSICDHLEFALRKVKLAKWEHERIVSKLLAPVKKGPDEPRQDIETLVVRLRRNLADFGLPFETIASIISISQNLLLQQGARVPVTCKVDYSVQSEATLKNLGLSMAQSKDDASTLLVKRWIPDYLDDVLWEHTNRQFIFPKNNDATARTFSRAQFNGVSSATGSQLGGRNLSGSLPLDQSLSLPKYEQGKGMYASRRKTYSQPREPLNMAVARPLHDNIHMPIGVSPETVAPITKNFMERLQSMNSNLSTEVGERDELPTANRNIYTPPSPPKVSVGKLQPQDKIASSNLASSNQPAPTLTTDKLQGLSSSTFPRCDPTDPPKVQRKATTESGYEDGDYEAWESVQGHRHSSRASDVLTENKSSSSSRYRSSRVSREKGKYVAHDLKQENVPLPQHSDRSSNEAFWRRARLRAQEDAGVAAPASANIKWPQPVSVEDTRAGGMAIDESRHLERLKDCEGCRRRRINCDSATTQLWPCAACVRIKLNCVPPTVDYDGVEGWGSDASGLERVLDSRDGSGSNLGEDCCLRPDHDSDSAEYRDRPQSQKVNSNKVAGLEEPVLPRPLMNFEYSSDDDVFFGYSGNPKQTSSLQTAQPTQQKSPPPRSAYRQREQRKEAGEAMGSPEREDRVTSPTPRVLGVMSRRSFSPRRSFYGPNHHHGTKPISRSHSPVPEIEKSHSGKAVNNRIPHQSEANANNAIERERRPYSSIPNQASGVAGDLSSHHASPMELDDDMARSSPSEMLEALFQMWTYFDLKPPSGPIEGAWPSEYFRDSEDVGEDDWNIG